ncbi:hypothetical protein JST97_21520 [bacterium]|nr:hypothetical protein [bacterium]
MRGTEQKTTLELKLEKLRSICEKSPDNAIGLLALAETAFRRGLRLEALEAYQKVLKDESVAEAHLCMAQMYRHHGLYQEAISELRTLFEMEPGYPEAHVFARELARDTVLPQDIEEILLAGCGNDELALARVRLSIARSLVLREGQELVAIQDANAGDPTFGYYICETRKRLTYCEEVLSQLAVLEEARRAYLADLDRQRQIERERQRAAEQPAAAVAVASQPEPEHETTSPLGGSSEQYTVAAAESGFFSEEGQVESQPVSAEAVVEQAVQGEALDVNAHPAETVEVEPTQLEHAHIEPAQVEPVHGEPLQVEPVQEEIVQEEMVQALPVELELEAKPPVSEEVNQTAGALWDDPPVYVLPSQETGPELATVQDEMQVDLTLHLTPTLEGSLPDPDQPGGLWEDGPVARYEETPPPSLDLGIPVTPAYYDSGLGDDLAHPLVEETFVEPEPQPVVEAPVAAVPVARNFSEIYAPLLAGLDGLIQTLAKTRSVSSVFLLNREGYAIAEQVKDSIGRDRLSEFIVETVSFLEAFATAPQYWVLECAGGIVVIQSVDSYHYLITIGQTGANFGALRYTMDRVRPNFEQVLQPACPA